MITFVDTSAFYAVFDRDDVSHAAAKQQWVKALREGVTLFTTNYVLVETTALLQSRLGVAAVRSFHSDVLPLLQVEWITEQGHRAGVEAVLAASRKKLSLVDCISFQTMRRHGVETVFCFDAHFGEQGFSMEP